jgi:hypothetical protein
VTAAQIGALTAELDPVANAALTVHTNRADNPHGVTAVQIGALTAELDPVANAKLAVHTNRTDNPHNVTAAQIGALTAELDPVANAALTVHTNRIDNPHSVTAVQIGALTAELDPVANAKLVAHTNRIDNPHNVTAAQIGALTAELDPVANAALVAHTNRADNPHSVTAAQIGALTEELDPVANAALVAHTNRTDNPHGVTAIQIGAITAEVDPVAGPRLDLIEPETNKWNAAYGWGDHALAGYLLPTALAPLATTQQVADAAAALAVHTNRTDNPHGVTASQVGALTNETDLAALRTYHYGSPDIVESPAEWFVFDGAGTITAFNWEAGRTNVAIPWAIGGVPVTAIGANAFAMSGIVSLIAPQTVTSIGNSAFAGCGSLTSVTIPQATSIGGHAFSFCYSLTSASLPQATSIGDYAFGGCGSLTAVTIPQATSIGDYAFYSCGSLASVSLPQATSIGDYAFDSCTSLTSVTIPQVTSIGYGAFNNCGLLTTVHMGRNAPAEATDVFTGITTPPKVYVTNPQATGWGDTWNGAPVVRPPLYADAIHQAGELVATTGHVAQAIAAIPAPDLSDRPTFAQIAASNALPYTAWTGTVTPQNGTATVAYAHGNMPVLVVPDGGGTTYVTVATGTYVATSGVSRVSLSIWAGTNAIELVTNEVDYVSAPDIPTNGWGTILFRRVSNGKWKGVGL